MWSYFITFGVAFLLEFAGAAYTISISRLAITKSLFWSGICSVLGGVAIFNIADDWAVLPVYVVGEILGTYCVLVWAKRNEIKKDSE